MMSTPQPAEKMSSDSPIHSSSAASPTTFRPFLRAAAAPLAGRAGTVLAMAVLSFAQGLIRFVPFGSWQALLGSRTEGSATDDAVSAGAYARICVIGERVERAAARLPFETKCLARAVATQCLARAFGLPARLVIAVRRRDAADNDRFHAWVEQGGRFVVGACDRSAYQAMLSFRVEPRGR